MSQNEYYQQIQDACSFLRQRIRGLDAKIAIALGSGLQAFGGALKNSTVIPYCDIPSFPVGSVKGHAGKLIHGYLDGNQILVFQGRAHLYEGFSAKQITFYVRVIQFLGIKDFIVTNSAGGINTGFNVGDFVVLQDQINLATPNALVGTNDSRLGPRFPDMSAPYCPNLRRMLTKACKNTPGDHTCRRGTYLGVLGPNYETPAEVRFMRTIGADVVGMSTTLEVMAAKHGGLNVGGLSLCTNMASGVGNPLNHDEVVAVGRERAETFVHILNSFFRDYFQKRSAAKL